MAKKSSDTINTKDVVKEYYEKLNHPLKDVLEVLQQILLACHSDIQEQIKWNSPCFSFIGTMEAFDPKEYKRDLLVVHLRKSEYLLLIFPNGKSLNDPNAILQGKFPDNRKSITLTSMEDLQVIKKDLIQLAQDWVQSIKI
jgi:hypothetical protein